MIQQSPNTIFYYYTVGLYQTYSSARQLQEDIVNNGIDAFVVAYVDGLRLDDILIKKYKEQCTDLQHFINGNNK